MDGNSSPAISVLPNRWTTALTVTIVFTLCGLLFWTVEVCQFVSSRQGQLIALAIAVGMGLITGCATWFDRTQRAPDIIARYPILKDGGARTAYMSVVSALVTFFAVNGAGLEFWTLATGRAEARSFHLGDYHGSTRASCAGFDLQETPFVPHRVICANYPQGENPPPPGTPVTVWGRASDVGIHVERFEIEAS